MDRNPSSPPWNKNRRVGRKPPLSRDQVHLIRLLLQENGHPRDRALFGTAIDTSFRGVDLVRLRVGQVRGPGGIAERLTVSQAKTARLVTARLSARTRAALGLWIDGAGKEDADWLFTGLTPRRVATPLTPNHYRDLCKGWFRRAGLEPARYGSHSLRRAQPAHLYRHTGNLRAAQLLLGHGDVSSTALYLGIEEEDALRLAAEFEL